MRRWRYAVYTQRPPRGGITPPVDMIAEGTVVGATFAEAVHAVADVGVKMDDPKANYLRVWEEGT